MRIRIKGKNYELKRKDIIDNTLSTVGQINVVEKVILISKKSCDIDNTILHELIHGFLFECGLSKQSDDESLVDWVAYNMFDILSVYETLKSVELVKGVTKKVLIKGEKYIFKVMDLLEIPIEEDSYSSGIHKLLLFSCHQLDYKLSLLNELTRVHLFETGCIDDYKDGELADWLSVNILQIKKVFDDIKDSKLYKELKNN